MPRGTENQESQEGRETPLEAQEAKVEAERTQEVVEQPQAVVERERPVQESEEIEREVIEAVEAVEKDGGPEPEDRMEQAAAAEEISATPIPLPGQPDKPTDEISATPIPLPGENLEDPEGEISATPIPLPGENLEGPEDQISATPIPLPGENLGDPEDEISATPIPLPGENQEGPGGEISATPIPLPGENLEGPEDQIAASKTKGSSETAAPSPDWDEEPPRPPQGAMEVGRPDTEDQDKVSLSPDDVKIDDGGLETADGKQTPTRPILEKELPEGGQMEDGLEQREDLQDMMDKDLDSLMPDGGEIVGADGKKVGGSKYRDDLKGIPGMDSGGKIDGSSEDPSGDQFAGIGMFKPGKGPDSGAVADRTFDEAEVMAMIESNASETEIAAKEKELQDKALDEYKLIYTSPKRQKPDSEDPPKPKKGDKKSSPDGEEGGSDLKAITQAELDAVLEETSGDQISIKDPDGQGEGVPDGHLKPEAAKKVKAAMDEVASIKHKQKKAGSEVVTDPVPEDPESGELSKKQGL